MDGDVPPSTFMVYLLQLGFRVYSYVSDFNNRNKCLTDTYLNKATDNIYHMVLIVKCSCGLNFSSKWSTRVSALR